MNIQPEWQGQLGPQARLQTELFKIETERGESWVVIVLGAAVMALGALSLLIPRSIWQGNNLEIRIPPQVLFVIMMLVLILALYVARREVEVQKYRLLNMQQILNARSD